MRRAQYHWASAHEVCLPNVQVDLSTLRFTVAVGDPTSEPIFIDLNEDRSWNHTCRNGDNVFQFSYIPTISADGEKEG